MSRNMESETRDEREAVNLAVATGVDSMLHGLPAATVMALGAPLDNDPTPLAMRDSWAQPGGGYAPSQLALQASRRRQLRRQPDRPTLTRTSMREWCLEHARIMSVWPAEPGNW